VGAGSDCVIGKTRKVLVLDLYGNSGRRRAGIGRYSGKQMLFGALWEKVMAAVTGQV
jgi:hypothetical protein